MSSNKFGWIQNEREVDRVLCSLKHPLFAQAAPHLMGTGDKKVSLLYEAVRKVWGRDVDSGPQQIGDCFEAGTYVRLSDGSSKKIEEVRPGDYVWTHLNNSKIVTRVLKKQYSGPMVKIKARGHYADVTSTADHQFVTYSNSSSSKYEWKSSSDLQPGEDNVTVPYGWVTDTYGHVEFNGKKIEVDEDFATVIGWYIAEGGCSGKPLTDGSYSDTKVTLNLCIDEENEADEIIRLLDKVFGVVGVKRYHKVESNSLIVEVYNHLFAKFIHRLVPGNVYSKRVPGIFLRSPERVKLSLLKAWIAGDGYVDKTMDRVQGCTVSPRLIEDFYHLAISCGLVPYVGISPKREHQNADGLRLFFYGASACLLTEKAAPKRNYARLSNLGLIREIKEKSIFNVEDVYVYCLEVEDDHSFLANGYAVHNCVSWASAGCVDTLACQQVLEGGKEEHSWDLRTCTEAIYALSRCEYGDLDGSYEDGSVGAWAAEALMKGGTLSRKRLGAYDPKRAKEWGAKGLPDDLEKEAKDRTVQTISQVRTWEEFKAALTNGYPVILCSMQGFSEVRDAKGRCKPQGTWAHALKALAFRDDGWSAGLIVQSWGDQSPTGPKGDIDIPNNSWWADATVIASMLRQGDSWVLSHFNGYPRRDYTIPWLFA